MKPSKEYRILVNHKCEETLNGHSLHIESILLDEHAIRVCYKITPPLPEIKVNSNSRTIQWEYYATDNMNNTYLEAGGAYGLSEDGSYTEGVISLLPLPFDEATSLKFCLEPSLSDKEKFKCSFTVNLNDKVIA